MLENAFTIYYLRLLLLGAVHLHIWGDAIANCHILSSGGLVNPDRAAFALAPTASFHLMSRLDEQGFRVGICDVGS